MPTTIRRWALVVFVAALVFAWRAETNQDVAVAQARKPIMMTRRPRVCPSSRGNTGCSSMAKGSQLRQTAARLPRPMSMATCS